MKIRIIKPVKIALLLLFASGLFGTTCGPKGCNPTSPNNTVYYTLNLNVNPPLSGTVIGTGGGLYGRDSFQISSGSIVAFAVIPDSNYVFKNWTEDGTVVSNDIYLCAYVRKDRAITANFEIDSNPADFAPASLAGKTLEWYHTATCSENDSYLFATIKFTSNDYGELIHKSYHGVSEKDFYSNKNIYTKLDNNKARFEYEWKWKSRKYNIYDPFGTAGQRSVVDSDRYDFLTTLIFTSHNEGSIAGRMNYFYNDNFYFQDYYWSPNFLLWRGKHTFKIKE